MLLMPNSLVFDFMQSYGKISHPAIGMLYVKKNHGSFVFLIEFVKEVIAINISTQPYFPHNIFQCQVYMRKGVRLQD